MKNKNIQLLITKATEDAAFFHALVFDPASVAGTLDKLEPGLSGKLRAIHPAQLIGRIISYRAFKCDENYTSTGPCGGTCGGQTCGVTCTEESCGQTCDSSCGYTTDFTPFLRFQQ